MTRERQDQSCKCGHREYEHGLDGVCDEGDCRCQTYRPTYKHRRHVGRRLGPVADPGLLHDDYEKQHQPRRCDG